MFTGWAKSEGPESVEMKNGRLQALSGEAAVFRHDIPVLWEIGDSDAPATTLKHEWPGGWSYTQVFCKGYRVGHALRTVSPEPYENLRSYELMKAYGEILRMLQHQVVTAAPSEDPQAARRMSGLLFQIPLAQGSITGFDALERLVDEVWMNGLDGNTLVYSTKGKDPFKGFRIHESMFGIVRLIGYRDMPTGSAVLIDRSRVSIVPLQTRAFSAYSSNNDHEDGYIVGEYALEVRDAEKMRGFAGEVGGEDVHGMRGERQDALIG